MSATVNRLATALTLACALIVSLQVQATNYTWDGTGDGFTWSDANNWDLDAGSPVVGDRAYIMTAASITAGVPAEVSQIHTGTSAVSITYSGTFGLKHSVIYGELHVGSGGLTFSDATISFPSGNGLLDAAGDLTCNGLTWGNNGQIQQTGGEFNIPSFRLPLQGTVNIDDWDFAAAQPDRIFTATSSANYVFVGSPQFEGTHRPDWDIESGYNPGRYWDLNGYTLIGDTVALESGGGDVLRYGYLIDDDGGTVDANELIIGRNGSIHAYVDLHGSDVIIRGSGTAYNNLSTNNTVFEIGDGTTVLFDPTSGALSVHTGSQDNGLTRSAWQDNFAFDIVQIGDGDTITLEGVQNILGSGNAAMYVGSLEGLGAGATMVLNGHNLYLMSEPIGITFDLSGGGSWAVIPEPATFGLLGLLGSCLALRRRR